MSEAGSGSKRSPGGADADAEDDKGGTKRLRLEQDGGEGEATGTDAPKPGASSGPSWTLFAGHASGVTAPTLFGRPSSEANSAAASGPGSGSATPTTSAPAASGGSSGGFGFASAAAKNPFAALSSGGFSGFGGGGPSPFQSLSSQASENKGSGFLFSAAAANSGSSTLFGSMTASSDVTEAKKRTAAERAKECVLPAESKQDTGEENERHVCQMRAKLFQFTADENDAEASWQERGTGNITLNEDKEGKGSRLVMRQDMSKRLVLNAPIWSEMALERITEKTIRIRAVNHAAAVAQQTTGGPKTDALAPQLFLIRTNGKDSELLMKELSKRVAECPKASVENGVKATDAATAATSGGDGDASPEQKDSDKAGADAADTAANEGEPAAQADKQSPDKTPSDAK